MERLGTACTSKRFGKLFAVWGLYSLAVTLLWQVVGTAHLPEYLAWALAAGLAVAALVETVEL